MAKVNKMNRNKKIRKTSAKILLFILMGPITGFTGTLDLSRPYGIGLSFVGTRQDASQIKGSGIGAGMELYLRYRLSPRFTLTGATGIFSVTDDIFKSAHTKSTLMPSIELRSEINLISHNWFRPFLVSGVHFFGASSNAAGLADLPNMKHD